MSKKNFKFKVGDRVEFEFDGSIRVGMIDEIDSRLNTRILVYSKGMDGHSASSSSKGRRNTMEYWWFYPKELRLKNNETIIIYRKGQEVIALDKTTGKKAVAECSPDDEFDFNIGSKLAFERLLGIEQPQYKEVKRKAKVGEYIKVTDAIGDSDLYENGSILKVSSIGYSGLVYCDLELSNTACVDTCEYVVLEGYKPPKEEATTKFLEKFEEGKIYVFRKELHDKMCPFCKGNTWTEKCDGKIVDVRGETDGGVGTYTIVPSWCEEIGYVKEK